MNIDLDYEISVFPCQVSKEDALEITIGEAIKDIKNCLYQPEIDRLRKGDTDVKKLEIPTASFHCKFEGRRIKENITEMSGLIIVDVDNIEVGDLEASKDTIMATMDSCFACFVSPSGDGLKCLYAVSEDIVTKDNYRQVGKEVSSKFERFGDIDVLSLTDCLIMSADSNIRINYDAIPDIYIEIKDVEKKKSKLEPRDGSKELFDNAQDFYETVLLSQIEQNADNNYHFIQMSVFELAKYGMIEDQELSFILEYTPSNSKKNSTRLSEAIWKAQDVEQTCWPYDFREGVKGIGSEIVRDNDDDEFYANFSDDEPEEDVSEDEDVEGFGIVDYNSMYDKFLKVLDEGDRVGEEISLPNFADIFRWKVGVTVVTGIPSHGKTEWVDQNIVDLARLSGWKTCVAGYEQTEEEHIMKLVRKTLGFDVRAEGADRSELREAYNFVTEYIKHVDVATTGGDIMRILKVFEYMVTLGFKNFVIDPFNLINIKTKNGGHEKVNDILQQMVIFCKKYSVSMIVIAHPTKMKKNETTGKFEIPDFYSVKGSSAFYEMAYHGLVVYRDSDLDSLTPVTVKVLKVKQNNLGERDASAYFRYLRGSGRYVPVDSDGIDIFSKCDWNKKNWHKNLVT